jgi:hypothetical protein
MSGPQPYYGHPNPHQPQYPQYPQQPQYWQYQQPREGIAVTTGYSPLAWAFAMVKPKIVVNGAEMPTSGWGRTVVPAPPGQYHVHVHTPYFLPSRVGPADISVNVAPGHLVELEYKAPVWTFSAGSLGPPPQSYNGQTAMIVVTIVALVVVFGAMLILALAGSM